MTEYSFVSVGGGRAMVIQSRIGGGWVKVADARTEHRAQELAVGLNKLKESEDTLSEILQLIQGMGVGSQDPIAALLISRGLLKAEVLG